MNVKNIAWVLYERRDGGSLTPEQSEDFLRRFGDGLATRCFYKRNHRGEELTSARRRQRALTTSSFFVIAARERLAKVRRRYLLQRRATL